MSAPLEQAVERLVRFLSGSWDLTADLSLATGDPMADELDRRWRHFRQTLLETLRDQEELNGQAAAAAARNSARTTDMQTRMGEMQAGMTQSAASLTRALQGATEAATGVARSAELVEQAHTAIGVAARNAAAMAEAVTEIARVVTGVSDQLDGLGQQSKQVADLSQVVKGIAKQVNLLSLNASIEAARAAEHGRGFAVVATEVRRLADGTGRQAQQIEAVIKQVTDQLSQASANMVSSLDRAHALTGQAQAASKSAAEIDRLVTQVAAPFEQLRSVMADHSRTLAEVSDTVQVVATHTESMSGHVELVAQESGALLNYTRQAQGRLGRFRKGSFLDEIKQAAATLAADLGAVFESAIASGTFTLEDALALTYTEIKGEAIRPLRRLCDVSRVPLTGFNPPKFSTRYDAAVDVALRDVLDSHLKSRQDLLYTGLMDLNGYAPVANQVTCRDWTGDFKQDAAFNRFKRLTTDLPQVEACRVGLKYPMPDDLSAGTYVRDLSTVLTRDDLQRFGNSLRQADESRDLVMVHTMAGLSGKVSAFCAVPLYIQGHRYGCALVGWEPQIK